MVSDYKQEIINLKNSKNENIHCVHNYTNENNPLIIIPPQYEKTIRTNLVPMLYLVNNGFNVFRYDNRYHKGNSTGDFIDFTFDTAYEDLCDVFDYIRKNQFISKSQKIGILGFSISNRIVVRYLAVNQPDIDVFLSIVGVIDMEYTLNAILEKNWVQEKLKNYDIKLGVHKVLKYPINWDNFLPNLIESNWHNLEQTKKEYDKLKVPMYVILGEKDHWINLSDYDYVFSDNKTILKEIYKLPNTNHELYKNPQAAEYCFYAMIDIFKRYWKIAENEEINKPTVVEIINLNKCERDREIQYS